MQEKICKACGDLYYGHGNSFYCNDCRQVIERSLRQKKMGHDPMGWYKKIMEDVKSGKYSTVEGVRFNNDYPTIGHRHIRGR